MTTTILLTIHAVTDWNEKRLKQGHLDTPINSRGQAMALQLARALAHEKIAAVYSSDLRRARETARPVAEDRGLTVHTDSRLRECRWVPEWGTDLYPVLPFPAQSETPETVLERVEAGLNEIAARHKGETVLVVSHGAAVRWFIEKITGSPDGYAGIRTAVNRLTVKNGQWQIVSLNESTHIDTMKEGDDDQLRPG